MEKSYKSSGSSTSTRTNSSGSLVPSLKPFGLILAILVQLFLSFNVNSQNTCAAPQIIASLPYTLASGTTCGTVNNYTTTIGGNTLYVSGEDRIFRFTPTSSGTVTISVTQPTNAYLGMYLYTGCPFTAYIGGVQNNVATKSFTATVTAGTTYFLMLDTWSLPSCTAFTNLTISAPAAAFNPCTTIPTLTCGAAATSYSMVGAAGSWSSYGGPYTTPGRENLFAFTPTTTGLHNFTVNASAGYVDLFWKAQSSGCNSTGWTYVNDILGTETWGINLTAGVAYYIMLDDEDQVANTGSISVACPGAPAYDPCTSITTISGCGTSATASMSGTGAGWSVTSCGYATPGQERLFSFTAPTTGTYTLNLTAITGGFVDFFWKAASGGCNAAGWNCIDDISVAGTYNAITPMSFTAGTTYYILLDPEGTGTYSATFNLGCPVPPPANDLCSGATSVACGATVTVNTANANTDAIAFTTCGTTITTPGVWYQIAGNGQQMTVSTVGLTTSDTKLMVYSGSCAGLTCVGGSDDFSGTQSQVTWNSVSGTTYYVLAALFTGTGSFPMSLSCVVPCAGTPNPGATTASTSQVFAGGNTTLGITTAQTGTGISYQWQFSSSASGPWTSIGGATSATYVASPSVATYYQCVVTCSASGASGTSTPILISFNPYCNPDYTGYTFTPQNGTEGTVDGDMITNVTITLGATTLLNNPSTAALSSPQYTFYSSLPTITMYPSNTYNVNVTAGAFTNQNFAVWIDYNDDNDFYDAGELIGYSSAATTAAYQTISFPINLACAPPFGTHRMRIRDAFATVASTMDPCATYGWGETEDYLITIVAGTPFSPTFAATPTTPNCVGNQVTYTATAGQTNYVWTLPGSATLISGGTSTSNTATVVFNSSGSQTLTMNYSSPLGCASSGAVNNVITVGAGTFATSAVNGDVVWRGASSTDWATPSNWYYYNGSTYTVAGVSPNNTTRTIIPSTQTCVSLQPTVAAGTTVNAKDVVIETGATLTMTTGTLNVNGNFTNNGTFVAGTGTVSFNTAGTVSGNATTFNNVDINNGVNFGSNLSTVNGTLSINAGGWVNTNPPIYGLSSLLKYNTGGTYGRWLEWSATSGAGYPNDVQVSNNTTINYPNTGGWFSTNLGVRRDLIIDAGSNLYMDYGTNSSGSLTIGRDVTAAGDLSLGNQIGGDIYLGGNWTRTTGNFYPNSRTVNFTGNAATQTISGTGALNFVHVTINKTAGVVSMNNDVSISGNLIFQNGNLVLNGKTLNYSGGYNITTNNGGIVGSAALSKLNFTASSQITSNLIASDIYDLTIGDGASVSSAGEYTILNNLTVGNGATFNKEDGPTLTFKGNIVNNGTITDGTSSILGGSFKFDNTIAQSIGGGQPVSVANLDVNKASGVLNVTVPVTVTGNLAMANGNIVNPSSVITLGTSSADPGTLVHTSGTITGALRRYFDASATPGSGYYFPVGNSSNTRGSTIDFTSSPGTNQYLTVRYQPGTAMGATPLYNGLPLMTGDGIVIQNYEDEGFWEINPTADNYSASINSAPYTMTLQMKNLTTVNDRSTVRIIKAAGSNNASDNHATWTSLNFGANPVIGASNTDFTVTGTSTGFSWFGAGSGNNNPLPVELVSFSGVCDNGLINLTWQTASEFNSSHFDVEKSRDGENWQVLTKIQSAGTSNELITYQTADHSAIDGNNYYRLRQVDIDGTEKVYDPINVSCAEVTSGYFTSFPNPSGTSFQVILNNKELVGNCTMNIVDATGKVIEQREIEVKDGINMFVINQEITPGIYFLNISNGLKTTTVLRHAIK